MESFLKQVTQEIFDTNLGNFQQVAVVFPNKRSILYFVNYLSKIIEKPIFLPEIYTINEIIGKFSNLVVTDDITLTYKLFQAFKKHTQTTENFDEFYFWGQMLLNDFEDIDKELINPKAIFSNLAEQKEIETLFNSFSQSQIDAIKLFWGSFNNKSDSEYKKKYLKIWEQLFNIYTEFNNNLKTNNKAYTGMMFKDAFSNFTTEKLATLNLDKIYFVGFNALSKVETEFFQFLKKKNIAQFYWDYDQYFLGNKKHEAGFFIKKHILNFPENSKIEHNSLTSTNKNVEIISTPSSVGQAKLLNNILSELQKQENFNINNTAIILADETLLIPVLHSLPKTIDKLNITMGFPLKETPAFSILINLLELQIQKKENKFYHKTVKALLNHPYIKELYQTDSETIINFITKNNITYVDEKDLQKNELFSKIFLPLTENNKFIDYITSLIEDIYEQLEAKNTDSLTLEYFNLLLSTIRKTNDLLIQSNIEINIKTYFSILKTILSSKTIPYEGEPIGGLQIMGILETRLLDFENIIFLSLNEGLLPKTSATNSFISYNLRKGFGIPTIENQDSIYGYYFYRILQRAKNIRFVYNSAVSFNNKEISRFLTQIKYEELFNITERNFTFSAEMPEKKPITIKKDENVLNSLNKYLTTNKKHLSPSALNTYIDCGLKFYFKYVAEINKPEEITEEIDYAIFGSILHKAIEILYQNFETNKTTINKDHLQNIITDNSLINNAIEQAFAKEYFNNIHTKKEDLHGRNTIIFVIIHKYIVEIIKKDIEYCPFCILSLEKAYYFDIKTMANNNSISISTGGIIDRVDKKNGIVRILDYKTGTAEIDFKSILDLTDKNLKKRPKAVFQTFIYSEAFKNSFPNETIIEPCIIKVKEIFSDNYQTFTSQNKEPINNYLIFRDDFLQELTNIVAEIFDTNLDFSQTLNLKNCEFCDFNNICNKL